MADHIYEIRLGWAWVYAKPSTFSQKLIRLNRGKRFRGHEAPGATAHGTDIWIARDAGGFVSRARVRDLGEPTATSEQVSVAVERFFQAVTRKHADLSDATRDLLEVVTTTGQGVVTRVTELLMKRLDEQSGRLDELERQIVLHQRHLQQIDLILDEQARAREVG